MRKMLFLVLAVVFLAGCQGGGDRNRPLIGITSVYEADEKGAFHSSVSVGFAYVRSIEECGGVPVVLPAINDEEVMGRYVEELDGLVLVGGADIPPGAYGEEPHETAKVMPDERYDFERRLIPMWLASGKPILGICLGMQFANVASGGSMTQDIPSQIGEAVDHRSKGRGHRVKIDAGSRLAEVLGGTEAVVYSNHHQAVKRLGAGLKVVGRSSDGVAEALERVEGGFGLFVQWHPELMEDEAHRKAIYSALVEACRNK